MLDPYTYRASEHMAKTQSPSWRVAQIHNVDHFEKAGFPVRINSYREFSQIVDTMQENRYERYMAELGGLAEDEYRLILDVCLDLVAFQLSTLPHRRPVLPISTILSAFALFKKMCGIDPNFGSVLEIGPGCGYVSFFLRRHRTLTNYSQIEACESFYLLQNLVGIACFGHRHDERALPHEDTPAIDYFVNPRPDMEFSPSVRVQLGEPLCTHYPWWRIGEIASRNRQFDIVTSNANLLEFNATALDDYLTLIQKALKPEGHFLVQCTGYPASGTVEQLLGKLYDKRFAMLMFVREHVPAQFPGDGKGLQARLAKGDGRVSFTTNNAIFVKPGHSLFERYYDRANVNQHFVADEPVVSRTFFERPAGRRPYALTEFLEATERELPSYPAGGLRVA